MAWEPNTAYKAQGKSIFCKFVPVLRTLCSLGLKILQRFCTFLWTLLRFSCAKNYGTSFSRRIAPSLCGSRAHMLRGFLQTSRGGNGVRISWIFLCFWLTTQCVYVGWNFASVIFRKLLIFEWSKTMLILRTFARKFSNIHFFSGNFTTERWWVSDVRNVIKMGGHRLRIGDSMPGRTP